MSREQAGLLLLVLVVVAWIGMWRGLRRRAGGHADLPELPAPPAVAHGRDGSAVVEGVVSQEFEVGYVTTTIAGDWLDRVLRHGLGHRGPAVLRVVASGVLLDRRGAAPIWIGVDALRGVRRQSGMTGKFVERDGLVVLTWRHGTRDLDTGVRPVSAEDARRVVDAVQELLSTRTAP